MFGWSFNLHYFFLATAVQPVLVVADVAAAVPGAEVDPDPGAATTTVAPGPAPTPGLGPDPSPSLNPSPSPNPELPGEASPSLPRGPAPGPNQEVEPHLPTGLPSQGPGPNPRVGLNLQWTTKQSLNPNLETI